MRVFVFLLAAACATPTGSRPLPSGPTTSLFDLRMLPPGECDPVEYTLAADHDHDALLRVDLSPDGRAARVELTAPTENAAQEEVVLDVALRAFHCRHPLTTESAHVVESYPIHFRRVQLPHSRKPCGQGVYGPDSIEARVAIDEDGYVVRAWAVRAGDADVVPQAIEALQRDCRFSSARVDGNRVPFVFRTVFTLGPHTDDGKPFDRVYPIQERRPF